MIKSSLLLIYAGKVNVRVFGECLLSCRSVIELPYVVFGRELTMLERPCVHLVKVCRGLLGKPELDCVLLPVGFEYLLVDTELCGNRLRGFIKVIVDVLRALVQCLEVIRQQVGVVLGEIPGGDEVSGNPYVNVLGFSDLYPTFSTIAPLVTIAEAFPLWITPRIVEASVAFTAFCLSGSSPR